MTFFGDGSRSCAFSHIVDVAPMIARSVEVSAAYNEVLNIGADLPHTEQKLAETVVHAFGAGSVNQCEPVRNEVQHAYTDHSRLRRIFGRHEGMTPAVGIARMATWAPQVGAWHSFTIEEIEISKKLPPRWKR